MQVERFLILFILFYIIESFHIPPHCLQSQLASLLEATVSGLGAGTTSDAAAGVLPRRKSKEGPQSDRNKVGLKKKMHKTKAAPMMKRSKWNYSSYRIMQYNAIG